MAGRPMSHYGFERHDEEMATDQPPRTRLVHGVVVAITAAAILTAVLWPVVHSYRAAREQVRQLCSQGRMCGIAVAMHDFARGTAQRADDPHRGSLPPAFSTDKNGKPLLSWRVLILRYCDGMDDLYNQFHLDEPWDSPHNRTLITKMPRTFGDPEDPYDAKLAAEGKTHYLTVRGPRTVFPGRERVRFSDITDGTDQTIMLVEVSDDRAVIWTKPDDFEYDENDPIKGIAHLRKDGFLVSFADTHRQFLPYTIDAKTLAALFTRNGGEHLTESPTESGHWGEWKLEGEKR
jgi:hypothetical protein